jgi:hypothetical protein
MESTDLAHCVSTLCSATPDDAFSYLSDPGRLGEWSLGCWAGRVAPDGTIRGTSLFDGAETFVQLIAMPEQRIVDYAVGDAPDALVRRISARVVPSEEVTGAPASSLLVLTAWRERTMDGPRWRRLVAAHEAEIHLLRHRIEHGAT